MSHPPVLQIRVSIEAQYDLAEIARYTEQLWGQGQRIAYLEKLEKAFSQLERHPSIGRSCDHVLDGYRCMPAGRHLVFYRVAEDQCIEVIRVLHKSMYVDSLM